jgi:uncharacterized protein (DUF1778 family)
MPKKFAASEARRAALNMKTTVDLRERLEKAAAASGRALTHEVEHRIEKSFLEDELRAYRALKEGDEPTRQLGESIQLTIGLLNNRFEENWQNSYAARAAVRRALDVLLQRWFDLNPLPEPDDAEGERAKRMEGTAGFIAKTMVGLVSRDPVALEFVEMWGQAIENPELMGKLKKDLGG